MSLSEKFIEWSSGRDFKSECHYDIVRDFDHDAEIWEHRTDPFDECGYYSTLTCVRFSDGSLHSFNYKGEW
jgi:hypothetical protein